MVFNNMSRVWLHSNTCLIDGHEISEREEGSRKRQSDVFDDCVKRTCRSPAAVLTSESSIDKRQLEEAETNTLVTQDDQIDAMHFVIDGSIGSEHSKSEYGCESGRRQQKRGELVKKRVTFK